MPITSVTTGADALTATVVADFPVPLRRLWDAYVDPRQLETFWGRPSWPATFTRHSLRTGGYSAYHMTGPTGEQAAGYWEVISAEPPYEFEIRDAFALPDGTPDRDLPTTRVIFALTEASAGSRLTVTTHFNSRKDFDQLIAMHMVEGMQAAMEQIDAVVTDESTYSASHIAQLQYLDDTTVRVSRVIRAPVERVWEAHHTPEIVRQWVLGPDGWVMTACQLAQQVGDTYRYEWETDQGIEHFGFTGELLVSDPPHYEVTTESMIGVPGPSTTNELNLAPVSHGTLITLVIAYPTTELRDVIIDTGMIAGMEHSYARLESRIVAP